MLSALAFLTPVGGARTPTDRTLSWFPLAGMVLGAVVGAAWWGASHIWPPAVCGAVVVAVDLALTGMLHFDGLVDSADGLLPHLADDRRLAVMKEPTVGAFGIAVAIGVVVLRFACFASATPDIALVAGLWCASRTVMAVAARALPYARAEGGLASAFTGRSWWFVAAYGAIAAVVLGAIGRGVSSAVAVLAAFVAGTAVVAFGRWRLGGFTGDVLGAAGVVAETVGLLVAVAKW